HPMLGRRSRSNEATPDQRAAAALERERVETLGLSANEACASEPALVAAARAAASRMALRVQRPVCGSTPAAYHDEKTWPSFSDDVTTIAQALSELEHLMRRRP